MTGASWTPSSANLTRMIAGRMMDFPLTITHLIERMPQFWAPVEVVSTMPDKSRKVFTYAQTHDRIGQLANALTKLGVKSGDRVATLSWNHQQHLECYFAIPAMGAIVHTLNLRLHADEIGWIANDAEDTIAVVDQSLLPLFERFRAKVPSIKHVIVVVDKGEPLGEGQLDYETLIAGESPRFEWPKLDENQGAMLCYTSGTTGDPKGVLYSHRSIVLHALVGATPGVTGISADDVVLPVVPMFHASAWGLPYISVLVGAKLVFPGPHLDAGSLVSLIEREKVTAAGGVPTIWLGILALLDSEKRDMSSVRMMLIGGSAAPSSMIDGFQKRHDMQVLHAWGMTETSPVGTFARVKPALRGDDDLEYRANAGLPASVHRTAPHRRRGEDPTVGRQGDGRARGAWSVRRGLVLQRSRPRSLHEGWLVQDR